MPHKKEAVQRFFHIHIHIHIHIHFLQYIPRPRRVRRNQPYLTTLRAPSRLWDDAHPAKPRKKALPRRSGARSTPHGSKH